MKCREYLNTIYNVLFENNKNSFIGTKKVFKYKIEIILKKYIDENFFEKTIKAFKTFGLIDTIVYKDNEVEVIVADEVIIGQKIEFKAKNISEELFEKKLDRVEKLVKRDYPTKVGELITEEELHYIKNLQNNKIKLCKDVIGYVLDELFFYEYEKDYGLWIYNLDREIYLRHCSKLKTYNREYFKLKFRKYKEMDKDLWYNRSTHFYREIMDKATSILDRIIYYDDELNIKISNKENSSLYMTSKINKVKYSKDIGVISFFSPGSFYCKMELEGVYIDENNLINIYDDKNNIIILDKVTNEEKKEIEYMVNVYDAIYGVVTENRIIHEVLIESSIL